MIKKEELFIGAWVKNDLGERMQVTEMGERLVMLAYNDLYYYEDLEPIPQRTIDVCQMSGCPYRQEHHKKYEKHKREPKLFE